MYAYCSIGGVLLYHTFRLLVMLAFTQDEREKRSRALVAKLIFGTVVDVPREQRRLPGIQFKTYITLLLQRCHQAFTCILTWL